MSFKAVPATTYASHTAWSAPNAFAKQLSSLPSSAVELADALEEFLIHHAAARALGFGVPAYAEVDRGLRSVSRLLEVALSRDARSLSQHRDLANYLYVTCHDFALLAASVFRSGGTEARLRVGFVDYLRAGRWEDHWLCEYRVGGRWRLLDAQLGRRAREGHSIEFDVSDVPRSRFRSGPEMWQAVRKGEVDPESCGVSFAGISGEWFIASNVLKDFAALAAVEVLPWDYWGPSRVFSEARSVGHEAAVRVDDLAEAMMPAPDSLQTIRLVEEQFAWAKPPDKVWSFSDGKLHEQWINPH